MASVGRLSVKPDGADRVRRDLRDPAGAGRGEVDQVLELTPVASLIRSVVAGLGRARTGGRPRVAEPEAV